MSFPKRDCAAEVGTGAAQEETYRTGTSSPNLTPTLPRLQDIRLHGLQHVSMILKRLLGEARSS